MCLRGPRSSQPSRRQGDRQPAIVTASLVQYQSFDDAAGDSNSSAKLARLGLPARLDGKSVLDIACNEGFFCQEAQRRGAARVLGIDHNERYIVRARERDPVTEYRQMDWRQLSSLDEIFDVVLLLSALHYAEDPAKLLRDAMDRLTPDGAFYFECGVAPGQDAKWETIARPVGDVVLHPTLPILRQVFADHVFRELGPSVDQRGDPVPRFAFRVMRTKPVVLLLCGVSGSGKSTFADLLDSGARILRTDNPLWTIAHWCRDPDICAIWNSGEWTRWNLDVLAEMIAAAGLEPQFAKQVIDYYDIGSDGARVTVLEGHALGCGDMAAAFAQELLGRGVYVWQADRYDL